MSDESKIPPFAGEPGRLLRALDALGKMFAIIGPDRKILATSANPALSSEKEKAGKYCYTVFFHRDAPCDNCGLETALAENRAVVTPRAEGARGTKGVLHNYIYPLTEKGAVESLVCLGLDLPARDAPVRITELSKSFLFNLIRTAVDWVIAADTQGKIRIFNETAASIFGYRAEEALTRLDIRDIYPDGGAFDVMEKLRSREFGGKGKLMGYQTTAIDKTGEAFPIRINASIVYEGAREIATIGFFRDMREEIPGQRSGATEPFSLGDFISGVTRQLAAYDMKFCSAVIDNGMATADRVETALGKQQKIMEKTKIHVPIGRVMVQLGIITEAQRDELLKTASLERMADAEKTDGARKRINHETHAAEDAGSSEPDTEKLRINVSEDKLTAFLFSGTQRPEDISRQDILKAAAGAGIPYGILHEPETEGPTGADPGARFRLVIARGKAPDPGTPPGVQYLFEADPLRIGTARDDGTTDWKDRGELPRAKAGDRLAEIRPGTEGSPGTDVFGQAVAPAAVADAIPKCGKGTALSEDGKHCIATLDGMVTIATDGLLTVEQAMHIDGDIGLETGHIHFEGHIEVAGSIQKGYRVRGHSLRAADIHGAEVHMAGDMHVTGGIYDSDIKCKDTLKVSHIHKSSVITGADLIVENEIIESKVETGGRCVMGDGNIIASEIAAKKGITAKNIGTEASKASILVAGVDQRRNRDIKNLKNKISVLTKEKKRLASDMEALKHREKENSRALGDAAQAQDRQMVKIRDLENRMQGAAVANDKKKTDKYKKKLNLLLSKKEQQDAVVEALLAQDEEISDELAALAADFESAGRGRHRLNEEMDALNAALATDRGIPVVKVAGTLAAGTVISGPRTTLTIREARQRVRVMETDKPDAEGQRKWRMEVMKF